MVTVKSYFDGSKSRKALTLAAIGADEATWSEMESRWEDVRIARGNPSHIHMTDLMALENIYKGWSEDERDYLVDGLLNALLSFRGNPNVFSFTCSINLADYEEVRLEKNLPSSERMCARFVFPHVMNWYAELPRLDLGRMEAYFDRGEKFMRHIEPDWRSKQIRKRHPQWELVNSIGQVVMEKSPALQMTDVVAWGRNRLTGGSHWETDPHYTTAVRACGSLYSIHRPIDKNGLRGFRYREEGFAAIDPQRKQREEAMAREHASEEFKRFDNMMRELMHKSRMRVRQRWARLRIRCQSKANSSIQWEQSKSATLIVRAGYMGTPRENGDSTASWQSTSRGKPKAIRALSEGYNFYSTSSPVLRQFSHLSIEFR